MIMKMAISIGTKFWKQADKNNPPLITNDYAVAGYVKHGI